MVCELDIAVPPQFSELMISHNRIPHEVLRLRTGHSPFLNMPERVATIVKRAAGERVDMEGMVVDGRISSDRFPTQVDGNDSDSPGKL